MNEKMMTFPGSWSQTTDFESEMLSSSSVMNVKEAVVLSQLNYSKDLFSERCDCVKAYPCESRLKEKEETSEVFGKKFH